MIDEESRMVGGTGDGLLPKACKVHDKNGHQDAHQGQERAPRAAASFAGRVPYNTAWFLDKNMDSVPEGVAAVLGAAPRIAPRHSSLPWARQLALAPRIASRQSPPR
jgi:hypothetical protein